MSSLKRLFPRALAAILVACVAAGCSSEGKKSGFLKRGDRYFKSGEYDKAKIEYLNLLRKDPRNVTAIRRLGTIWYEQGAPLNAAPCRYTIERVKQIAPIWKREFFEGGDVWIEGATADPDDVEARVKLAFVFISV